MTLPVETEARLASKDSLWLHTHSDTSAHHTTSRVVALFHQKQENIVRDIGPKQAEVP